MTNAKVYQGFHVDKCGRALIYMITIM